MEKDAAMTAAKSNPPNRHREPRQTIAQFTALSGRNSITPYDIAVLFFRAKSSLSCHGPVPAFLVPGP
jgi:hypothetical protein